MIQLLQLLQWWNSCHNPEIEYVRTPTISHGRHPLCSMGVWLSAFPMALQHSRLKQRSLPASPIASVNQPFEPWFQPIFGLFSYSVFRGCKDHTMSSDLPKHEMIHFPNMTTALPSKPGEVRRVLWTGLSSQVVLMTVPVDGDIGDEVCRAA